MLNPIVIITIVLAVLSSVFFIAGIVALRKKRFFGVITNLTMVMLLLSLAGFFGMIAVTTQGYRALTHEEVVAFVKVESTGPQRFNAHFKLTDGREETFNLAGDELYVDAHILKWKPIANILGLHTAYELDRVAGRYSKIDDEKTSPRTIFSISQDKPVDMFNLRLRYPFLKLLLDTEYGSATFIMANKPDEFELLVSITGLLIRKSTKGINIE